MTLDDVREIMRERSGAMKAWVLTIESIDRIVADLGVKGGTIRPDPFMTMTLPTNFEVFGIPVVVVYPGQPEGVIV